MNYYPRYPGHYVAKTLHLTMEQDGAYTRLLDWCYLNERAIPHDARYAITRAMTASERKSVDAVLAEFFLRVGEGWTNDRAADEIAAAQPKIAAARANGRKGGRPKKNPSETQEKPSGFPEITQDKPKAKAPQSPIKSSSLETTLPTPPAADGGLAGRFEGHSDKPASPGPTPAGLCAIALTRAGFQVTSINATLLAYLREGGSQDHLLQLAAQDQFKGKGAGYLLAAARRELTEPPPAPQQGGKGVATASVVRHPAAADVLAKSRPDPTKQTEEGRARALAEVAESLRLGGQTA